MIEDEDITRDDEDRIIECSGCDEEACICLRICHECKMWEESCICPPVIAHTCSDCGETGEADLEAVKFEGHAVTFPICGFCGSGNVEPVDEAIDAAEYSKGDDR